MDKKFYILTDGHEFSGKPVEMTTEELREANDHADEHSAGTWWWTPYDREDEDMHYWVMSLREELPQDY